MPLVKATNQTPLWINLGIEAKSLSYIQLATDVRWRDYFYTYEAEYLRGLKSGPLLDSALPIRPEVIDSYTKRHKEGKVAIARQFPSETYDETLPNIVELAMWWIARTKNRDGIHGMSADCKTPSSTRFGEGMLCLEFVRNEYLDVDVNNPTYIVVSSDKLQ